MKSINALTLKTMFITGAHIMMKNKTLIDSLNVFPVPDGDTGTNMSLTLESAVQSLEEINEITILNIGQAITKGSLMGARGNSGVILSQLLRGFASSIEAKDDLSVEDFALAFDNAREVAYKAVIKPVEGTILTVVRETAQFAMSSHHEYDDVPSFFIALVNVANQSLQKTPELLDALQEAGVVDSGGKGFVCLLEGMYKGMVGEDIPVQKEIAPSSEKLFEEDIHIYDGELEFGYCTEFMVMSDQIAPEQLKEEIENFGDSLIVVGDDGLIKIHIHTNEPGQVLAIAGGYGGLDRIKIENMRLQHSKRIARQQSSLETQSSKVKPFAVISVAMGQGIQKIMESLGVDHIISGGQSMNPSTQDFMNIIEKIPEQNIFILPNNKNIIMAANQAKELSAKNIHVLPTKTIPQGISCLININQSGSFKENEMAMIEAIDLVHSGKVTFAIRDTMVNGLSIQKDDIIGISEQEIVVTSQDIKQSTISLVQKMVEEDTDIISLFYGKDVQAKEAESIQTKLQNQYPDVEVELYQGGQPLYYFIVSVE